jgi:hypothetical protein
MKRTTQILCALMVASTVAVPSVSAQGAGAVNNDSKNFSVDADVSESVDILSTVARLAHYGYENSSPAVLVAAAKLLMDNPPSGMMQLEDGDVERAGVAEDSKSGEAVHLDAERLLADAAAMSSDEDMHGVIAAMQSTAGQSKGSTRGAGSESRRIGAQSTQNFWIQDLRGGEYARIDVRGDGDTDLDCWLYDENGNLIDSDTDYTDWCILEAQPQWTGPFRIQVTNLGTVWNGAVISWN